MSHSVQASVEKSETASNHSGADADSSSSSSAGSESKKKSKSSPPRPKENDSKYKRAVIQWVAFFGINEIVAMCVGFSVILLG